MWRASTGVIHCIFDQIPNLQNGLTTPNKNLGGEGPNTDKHLPSNPFTGQFLRKNDLQGLGYSYLFGPLHALDY